MPLPRGKPGIWTEDSGQDARSPPPHPVSQPAQGSTRGLTGPHGAFCVPRSGTGPQPAANCVPWGSPRYDSSHDRLRSTQVTA